MCKKMPDWRRWKYQLPEIIIRIWYGDAQDMIQEQLGLKSSTLAKCSVVGQDDIMSIIAGKETEMNNVMHDLLDLRTLVDIGPILKRDEDAEKKRKELSTELEGPSISNGHVGGQEYTVERGLRD